MEKKTEEDCVNDDMKKTGLKEGNAVEKFRQVSEIHSADPR